MAIYVSVSKLRQGFCEKPLFAQTPTKKIDRLL
jgi:hypothetical protein